MGSALDEALEPYFILRRRTRKVLLWLVGLATSLLTWYTLFFHFSWLPLYFPLFFGVAGVSWWVHRAWRPLSGSPKRSSVTSFLLRGYGMVAFEEVCAALVGSLSEGSFPDLFGVRVLQYWLLNFLMFAGIFLTIFILYRHIHYALDELLILVGICGIFAERVAIAVFVNPPAFFLYAPVVAGAYALIVWPATRGLHPGIRWRLPLLLRAPLFFSAVWLASSPFVGIAQVLRATSPALFPPTSLIP